MAETLNIAFLWHMHQPYYKDPLKGEYALPWVYLHAVKDYYDMAAIVDECDGARVTFNLVPSLLDQIIDYASGEATDPFLIRGRMPASDLGDEDRRFILDNFFSANRQRMIEPYPRYLELLNQAGLSRKAKGKDRPRALNVQDYLDLQVWFFLAWTGEAVRRRYPAIKELLRKERNFTEQDKATLFDVHQDVLNQLIPLYKKLHDDGKAELAVSPYYHPILPLLCELKSALTAMPKVNLPAARFRHPEDARCQVSQGVASFEKVFGFRPVGMWPSEGSVSDEALNIIAGCGLSWVATDEEVLARTLGGSLGQGKSELYHPYTFQQGARELRMFFRDHQLSDLIGFTYSQWEPKRAINDFVSRLLDIRKKCHGARVAPIILDGENAWEYYQDNAFEFLKGLYTTIGETKGLKLTTFSEATATTPSRRQLGHVHPGSWINANYGIWIGHPEENLAWDLLERTRDAAINNNPFVADLLAVGCRSDGREGPEIAKAEMICRSLYAAEGSDWFWWYGDDHFSPHSDRFDRLFRKHLMNVYRLLSLDVPRELFDPIKKKSPAGKVREPAAFISPTINGQVDDYFEWLAAGLFDLTKQSSAMHAAENPLLSFFYGFDRDYFYIRLDSANPFEALLRDGDQLLLTLVSDHEYQLAILPDAVIAPVRVGEGGAWRDTGHYGEWASGGICEIRLPLAALALQGPRKLSACLALIREGEEFGRWPPDSHLDLAYAGQQLEQDDWLI